MPSTEPIEKVVATGVSLVVGLSDNMQITFQSGFEGDETDAAVNARLDRLIALANRQKAIAEVPMLENELFKHREELAQFQEDLDRVELDYATAQEQRRQAIAELEAGRAKARKKFEAEINVMILEMQDVRQETFNAGLGEHQRSGRSGSYVPKGHVATNIAKIDKQIETAKDGRERDLEAWDIRFDERTKALYAEIEKAEAERDQYVANLNVSIRRYTDAIASREEKLQKARAAAGG